MALRVSELHIYPIKGCRGITPASVFLEPRGFRHDRRWMLVHADTGGFLSQRAYPDMARATVAVSDTGDLTVAFAGQTAHVPHLPDGELPTCTVSVWSFTGEALDCGDEAAQFFEQVFRFPVRLVRVPDNFARRVNPQYAKTPDDATGFADGFPVLVANEASLADLNQRLAVPVPMNRFRPNLVISGDMPAWHEHAWESVRVGDALLYAVKPCDRCAVTTIDQNTGARTGAEPLATLATFRRDPNTGKVNFGVNLIPDAAGAGAAIRVGDEVSVG